MKVLITGAAGFIGGHFLNFALKNNLFKEIKVLDNLTYASNPEFIYNLVNTNQIEFFKGSICDSELVSKASKKCNVVINFAAESHVDNSILNPIHFMESNILGVGVILDCLKRNNVEKFVQISTDEVYGSIESGAATEKSNLNPASPYSSSKAAADLIVNSFHKTFGINTLISRTTNNYGPRQHSEKLIPKIIKKMLRNESIPIYGNGNNIRNWIYVEDNCIAISRIISKGNSGDIYNIAGDIEISNIDLVHKISTIMNLEPKIDFVTDRLGHDYRYAVDDSKIRNLGFIPQTNIESGLKKTIEWYLSPIC